MKKTLIALSVAALAVPFTATAESNLTVSGVVQIQIGDDDSKDATTGVESELTVSRGDVRINFAADTELSNGMTGYGNVQLEAEDGVGGNVAQGVVSDSVKVGVKGDFGDLSFGDVGGGYGKGLKGGDLYDKDPGNSEGIAYSNSFGAVGFKASLKPAGNAGAGTGSTEAEAAFSMGADYAMDNGLSVGAGIFSHGDHSRTSVGAGYSLDNGLALGVQLEAIEDGSNANEADATVIGANASYGTGAWTFAGKFYQHSDGDDDIGTKVRVEATNALADDMSVNFRITSYTDDITDGAGDNTAWRVLLSKKF